MGRLDDGAGRGGPTYRSGPPRRGRWVFGAGLRREGGWRQIAEARVRSHLVVVPAPGLDRHLGLGAQAKPFQAQALVAELAVEALVGAFLPGSARIDQRRVGALIDGPRQQRAGDELRPIVGPQGERNLRRSFANVFSRSRIATCSGRSWDASRSAESRAAGNPFLLNRPAHEASPRAGRQK